MRNSTLVKKPTPEQVKNAREAACLTQSAAASRFGYALRTWQSKEDAGANGRSLSPGEYELLLLLANQHPVLKLKRRNPMYYVVYYNTGTRRDVTMETVLKLKKIATIYYMKNKHLVEKFIKFSTNKATGAISALEISEDTAFSLKPNEADHIIVDDDSFDDQN